MTSACKPSQLDRQIEFLVKHWSSVALPGTRAQRHMAVELSYGRHRGPCRADAYHAAVMIVMIPRPQGWVIPLTLRPRWLMHHGGQISLPGGRFESGETDWQAAERETQEEIGVDPDQFQRVGKLSEIYVFASNNRVQPLVSLGSPSLVFKPCSREVELVIEYPVAALLQSDGRVQQTRQRGNLDFTCFCYRWNGHTIWGATAMILCELSQMIQAVKVESP